MEDTETEGVDQSNQKGRGYKGVDPADYTVSETPLINVVEDDEPTKVKSPMLSSPEIDKHFQKPSTPPQGFQPTQKSQQAISNLEKNFEKDLAATAAKQPEFKFTKQPNGDFSFARKEALTPQDPRLKMQSPQSSAQLHTKDKSQMQGVNMDQRPTMTDPKRDPFKTESSGEKLFGDASEEYESLKKKYKGAELQQKQQALLKRLKKSK